MERLLLLLHCATAILASGPQKWSYHGKLGPSNWQHHYPNCGGAAQSPININTIGTHYRLMNPFRFYNYHLHQSGNLENHGHSVQLTFSKQNQYIKGGGLDGMYNVLQFHFHWGSDKTKGSEHLINGHQFPLEMHIVHRKDEYDTTEEAVKEKDGLAVLSVLFKVGAYNPQLEQIIKHFGSIRNPGTSTPITAPTLLSLLPKKRQSFFRYAGSLTTPGCFEAVVWTLFANHLELSASQLREFTKLLMKDEKGQLRPIVDNFRPVQPLNGRHVYKVYAHYREDWF